MMNGMVFADRYELAEFIGQGGMSLVYRALDIRTGHSVAIKILKSEYNSDKEFLERFQREAQAASLMSNHNIVNLLDVGVEGEYRYLVLEYVSGNTLKEIVRQKGQLSTNTAIQIAIRILSALQHAHDNGIIHRDIKPQNVLVHSDGHVKVADFGIARMTNAFTITKGDTVVGSVHYSSPEQASGTVVDGTSDIYSTGVVLYEMLTGHVPFSGDTPVAVAMQHIQEYPVPISNWNPSVPPVVEAVVMRALEKSPGARYQTAREMADALARARDGKEEIQSVRQGNHAAQASPQQPGNKVPPQEGRSKEVRKRLYSDTGRRARQRRPNNRILSGVLTILMVAVVLGFLVLGVMRIYTQVVSSAVAPDVRGVPMEEAENVIRREGLNWQRRDVNHDTIALGVVISQIPEADTPMMKGDSVVVTVSLGPLVSQVPDVMNLSRDEATAKLKEKGFGMVVFRIASNEDVGTVLSQNPQKNMPAPLGSEVEVTVSGGSTTVPDVAGLTFQEAAAMLQENDLWVNKLEYQDADASVQSVQVVGQSLEAGTLAILNAQVTLSLSGNDELYHGIVNITPPEGTGNRKLRITLWDGESETEQFVGIAPTLASPVTLAIPLSSKQQGSATCRVYLEERLIMEQEVTLQ